MELEHSFTVPVPMERAWDVLLDVERVAPCMPGATLDTVTGDEIAGKIKVKVGPITMTYAGHGQVHRAGQGSRRRHAGGIGQGNPGRRHGLRVGPLTAHRRG